MHVYIQDLLRGREGGGMHDQTILTYTYKINHVSQSIILINTNLTFLWGRQAAFLAPRVYAHGERIRGLKSCVIKFRKFITIDSLY